MSRTTWIVLGVAAVGAAVYFWPRGGGSILPALDPNADAKKRVATAVKTAADWVAGSTTEADPPGSEPKPISSWVVRFMGAR